VRFSLFSFFVFVVVIFILCDCESVFVMFCRYLCNNGCILIQNVFTKARENTPTLVRNLLLYLDLRDHHTYMNTCTLLQRTSGSPSNQSNHNGLLD
jgi:hypothetical protein